MNKKPQTICGVKRECKDCRAAKWNNKGTKVIGCNFGHKKINKRKKLDSWKILIGINIMLIISFSFLSIFINNPFVNIVVLLQFIILSVSTREYLKHKIKNR